MRTPTSSPAKDMGKSPFKKEGYMVESTQPFKLSTEDIEGHGEEDDYDEEYDREVDEEEKVF